MTSAQTNETTGERPLRLWPGVVIVVLQWLGWVVAPLISPEALFYSMMGGLLGGLTVMIWWAFFSRAPRFERWGAVILMLVALVVTPYLLHESLALAGMGMLYPMYAVPVLSLLFVIWAVVGRRLAATPRRATMVATILIACCGWTLVRTHGVSGSFNWDFGWRWTQSSEERLLAQAGNLSPAHPPAAAVPETMTPEAAAPGTPSPEASPPEIEPEWPGFRGPRRDGVVAGTRIETDWSASPPVELWRRPVGPAWSSFAVHGDLVYTQEQRGKDEVVTCYRAGTGEPVWTHQDPARFWEAMAGAGPRGTPTLAGGRVYALGATGILNALDAADGTVVWSSNVGADTDTELPGWGFSSSPLVVEDVVIVAAAGTLAAYDLATGELRWVGPAGVEGYSSPHLLTLDGVPQVLLLSGTGAVGLAPADGTQLWEHAWAGFASLQPAVTLDGDLLITVAGGAAGVGIRRITVSHGAAGWTVDERWMSRGLKPYFSDFVIHEDHAFGFDGSILSCIDLAGGARKWKGGRYGHGQLVLLADQGLLLVVSEKGELALVEATPDGFNELGRIPAIEGKTWNHPVVAGGILLVRNSEEMVAFRLSRAS